MVVRITHIFITYQIYVKQGIGGKFPLPPEADPEVFLVIRVRVLPPTFFKNSINGRLVLVEEDRPLVEVDPSMVQVGAAVEAEAVAEATPGRNIHNNSGVRMVWHAGRK